MSARHTRRIRTGVTIVTTRDAHGRDVVEMTAGTTSYAAALTRASAVEERTVAVCNQLSRVDHLPVARFKTWLKTHD